MRKCFQLFSSKGGKAFAAEKKKKRAKDQNCKTFQSKTEDESKKNNRNVECQYEYSTK